MSDTRFTLNLHWVQEIRIKPVRRDSPAMQWYEIQLSFQDGGTETIAIFGDNDGQLPQLHVERA